MMNYEEYIVRNANICGGEPVVRGTRVTVRTILASLAEGASTQDILDDFPTLTVVTDHKLRVRRPKPADL